MLPCWCVVWEEIDPNDAVGIQYISCHRLKLGDVKSYTRPQDLLTYPSPDLPELSHSSLFVSWFITLPSTSVRKTSFNHFTNFNSSSRHMTWEPPHSNNWRVWLLSFLNLLISVLISCSSFSSSHLYLHLSCWWSAPRHTCGLESGIQCPGADTVKDSSLIGVLTLMLEKVSSSVAGKARMDTLLCS